MDAPGTPLLSKTSDASEDALHYLPIPLPVSLSLESVSYTVPQRRSLFQRCLSKEPPPPIEILNSVSCYVKPKAMVAVLGSSGAGKTTLLDILADRNKSGKLDGKLYMNNEEARKSRITLKSVSSYVIQEDEYIPSLTVQETLSYAQAMFLRNPSPDHIGILLDALKLTKVKNTIVGNADVRGISGGQRRRLSIALGLLSNPSVLLLDEPTSGLDSPNALRCVRSLNQLCQHGLSIVCSIHQPRSSIFHQFDLLLLLHKGTTVYFGPASSATKYFETHLQCSLPPNTNPADFFLDVLETDSHALSRNFSSDCSLEDSLHDFDAPVMAFSTTSVGKEMLNEIKRIRETPPPDIYGVVRPRFAATRFQRTHTLIRRTFTAKTRAGKEFIIAPLAVCALAVLAGFLFGRIPVYGYFDWSDEPQPDWEAFNGKRMTIIFFSIIMFSLQSLPQLGKQVQERAAFQRERAGGMYSALEYFLAVSITDTPLHVFITGLFTLIIYKTVELLGDPLFYMVSMYVVLLFGYSASHLIILLSSDAISALAACMALIAFSFLLNGQVISRDHMNEDFYWLYNCSYMFNAFEMMTVNEMEAPELVEAWDPYENYDNTSTALCFKTSGSAFGRSSVLSLACALPSSLSSTTNTWR